MSRNASIGWNIAGGVAFGLSFPPIGWWPLAWAALVPLFVSVAGCDLPAAFKRALVFFTPALLIPYHWFALHAMTVPGVVSLTALLAVIVLAAAAGSIGAEFVPDHAPALRIGVAAWLLTGLEWVLMNGPVPFPAVAVGYTQASSVWADSVLRVTGLHGVSVILVVANAAGAIVVVASRRTAGRMLFRSAAVLILLAFFGGWIGGSVRPAPMEESGRSIAVSLVQPALSPQSWAAVTDPGRMDRLADRLETLTSAVPADNRGLVVLPETAVPETLVDAEAWLAARARQLSTSVLAGTILKTPNGAFLNAAILADSTGVQGRYEKQVLVPFAERVPFAQWLPTPDRFEVPAGGVSSYVRGGNLPPIDYQGVKLGVLICFESLIPGLARRSAAAGADVLVVLTQDGWWQTSFARRQHLLYSRMRAVETGRPLVQVSVDGETAVIGADGRLEQMLPPRSPGILSADVSPSSVKTWYVRTRERPLAVFLGCTFILLCILTFRVRRSP